MAHEAPYRKVFCRLVVSFFHAPAEVPVRRRLRYVIEGSVLAVAAAWLAFESVNPVQDGFTPPESSWSWSWSDLEMRSSPSIAARKVAHIQTGDSVRTIHRPDGWAAVFDPASDAIIGFITDSALHTRKLPLFANAYSHVDEVLETLRTDYMLTDLEDPQRLRHLSNGLFEAVGEFAINRDEPSGKGYTLLVLYTDDNDWQDVSLTLDRWSN